MYIIGDIRILYSVVPDLQALRIILIRHGAFAGRSALGAAREADAAALSPLRRLAAARGRRYRRLGRLS